MHPTLLTPIQYLWETIQILLQFICSYPIKFFFFWINNKTKAAATAHHYDLFFFLNLKYASYFVDTYTIHMGNYSNSTTIYLFISNQFFFFWISNKTKAATAHHHGLFYFLFI